VDEWDADVRLGASQRANATEPFCDDPDESRPAAQTTRTAQTVGPRSVLCGCTSCRMASTASGAATAPPGLHSLPGQRAVHAGGNASMIKAFIRRSSLGDEGLLIPD
jgi:hypothetical protein